VEAASGDIADPDVIRLQPQFTLAPPMTPRILVLDTTPGAGLAVVRSLGDAGIEIHVAMLGTRSVAEHSRFCRRSFELGNPLINVQEVGRRLLWRVSNERYDLLMPITDTATELCAKYRDVLEQCVPIAMPSTAAYLYAHNKARLLQLGTSLDIPVPEHVTLSNLTDLARVREIDLGWPCYVKPIHSVMATYDRLLRFQVIRVANRDDLVDVARFHLGRVPIMIQRACPGVGVGVYVLAWKGQIRSLVQQRRLHEPVCGGGGSYRITEPIDPMLEAYARGFVAATGWSGVAMLEFKMEPGPKRAWLMEVNGRFWGSLALTIRAGLDYPLWLVRLYLEGRDALPSRLPQPKCHVRQRHLRHDVVWVARNTLREANHLGVLSEWARGFRHVLDGSEAWDTERFDDPGPALAEWWQDTARGLRPIRRRVARTMAWTRHVLEGRRRGLRALDELRGRSPRVLFMCAGNICRSPFAELYMRQRLGYSEVRSCGTQLSWNRLVPAAAEDVARVRFGVDLTTHRSAAVSRETIDWANVIVAMDSANLAELRARGKSTRPVILLGDVEGGRITRDPYGGDADAFARTFGAMVPLLTRLHERLVVGSATSLTSRVIGTHAPQRDAIALTR
jgi:protein-tyrosine-phosphatase/predicted ATP-grasp superfamily ATP-dependent carboligase